MHHRRIASFLIGLWIAGTVLMVYFVNTNRGRVDDILGAPSAGAARVIERLPPHAAVDLLHYHAAEQSRHYVDRWELAQMALCIVLAGVLFLGTHVNRFIVVLCGVSLLLLGFMHWVLTPEITFIGRGIDFVAEPGGAGKRLWALQALYIALDLLKLALTAVIAGYLFVFKTRLRQRSSDKEPEAPLARV